MQKAEMKIVSFGDNDVVATSGGNGLPFTTVNFNGTAFDNNRAETISFDGNKYRYTNDDFKADTDSILDKILTDLGTGSYTKDVLKEKIANAKFYLKDNDNALTVNLYKNGVYGNVELMGDKVMLSSPTDSSGTKEITLDDILNSTTSDRVDYFMNNEKKIIQGLYSESEVERNVNTQDEDATTRPISYLSGGSYLSFSDFDVGIYDRKEAIDAQVVGDDHNSLLTNSFAEHNWNFIINEDGTAKFVRQN